MLWSFSRRWRRLARFALPILAALVFLDSLVSWDMKLPPIGASVWLAGIVFAWIWLDVLDRDDA